MRRAVSNDIGPSRGPPTAEQLARLLAHDLRTPLNAIRGFADLVLAGAAGPLAAAQAELLTEIARAGRALEVSVGLAQEVGEFHTTPVGEDAAITLADMLQECGFVPATTLSEDAAERRLSGAQESWRRLFAACHAHLQGDHAAAPSPTVTAAVRQSNRLELTMERTDMSERWQMSVLREQLIRQLTASLGGAVSSRAPHLPLQLQFGYSALHPVAGL